MKVTTRIRQKLTKSAIVQDNEMIYLYKAIHGSVAHSEANSVAKKAKLYIPSAINIDIILFDNVKSWVLFHFSSLYSIPYIELYVY